MSQNSAFFLAIASLFLTIRTFIPVLQVYIAHFDIFLRIVKWKVTVVNYKV